MSQTTPQVADTETIEDRPFAPRVRILLTAVADADIDAALAVVARQVYEPAPDVVVVGAEPGAYDGELPTTRSLDEAIGSTDPGIDYLWLLHSDARPRPDALAALISEIERNEASLAGSKLLKAGTMDELESVGGATDVFGEPFSGLDEGEIDLQQYDVVREVAFVESASMLVRRDLAQGLKGLDPRLPPVAAGLDFSQRSRLAGGRVISVPSSEVYHQARCEERSRGWREQAGRLRAMLIAYSPLTLLWVIPYDFLVSIVDSLASLVLLQWRPLVRHLFSWAWNTYHLPSTIIQRRRFRPVRAEGDEELFRFQSKGSVRLRAIGEELSGRVLSMFDDDQALARGTRRLWGSPGVWGAVAAGIVALLGARAIVFGGMPNTGLSFPFEAPSIALERWFGGWNESGLGSAEAVHPVVGLTGLFSLVWFGLEGVARTLLTVALSLVGVVGMGRLGGRVGLRGPGRYLAGLVLMAGPGTSALLARGSWTALGAAAFLPWAVRAVFAPSPGSATRLKNIGWALLLSVVLSAFSPVLALAPLVTVTIWWLVRGDRASFTLALAAVLGGIAGVGFLAGDAGWMLDESRALGATVGEQWPVLVLVAAAPMFTVAGRIRAVALTGGLLSLGALVVVRVLPLGPGLEEAVLVMASFGAGLAAAAALDSLSRDVFRLASALGAVLLLVFSATTMANGRLGLPGGDDNARLSFATTLAGQGGPGRILHASIDRDLIPGEVRSGPGFWYRVLDGTGTTVDETWLPSPQPGDDELDAAVSDIASGEELRPGQRLAPFAIDWVVLEGPAFRLDEVLIAQLDLIPIPLDPSARVFENPGAAPLAGLPDEPWARAGTGFEGERVDGPVPLAVTFDEGWGPDASAAGWAAQVDGSLGAASYSPSPSRLTASIATIAILVAAVSMIVVGRRRR